jgi:hypothetical protein
LSLFSPGRLPLVAVEGQTLTVNITLVLSRDHASTAVPCFSQSVCNGGESTGSDDGTVHTAHTTDAQSCTNT